MTRGRPREFDPDATLEHALAVFERDGFESASVQSLADAMGICKPSLYAAYGNKEGLFIAALNRYTAATDSRRVVLLEQEPDAARAIEAMLEDVVGTYTQCATRGGCLIVAEAAGGALSTHSPAVREALGRAMSGGQQLLFSRLERARRDGDLPAHTDVRGLVEYFMTVMAGLSVLARGGSGAEQLRGVVRTAMQAWPARARSPRVHTDAHTDEHGGGERT